MKIVDAFWEIRNLGVKTIEISVERKDLALSENEFVQAVENYRQEYDAKYIVVKSDTRYPAISIYLQKAGFFLIENQISLRTSRNDGLKSLEDYRKNFAGKVSYRLAKPEEIEMVCSEIAKGIFTTDRIALDTNFGIDIANRRYIFWLQDEIKRGALLYLDTFNNEAFGFFLHKPNEERNSVDDILGGVFNSYKNKYHSVGIMSFYSTRMSVCDNGYRVHKTAVSSNNVGILILHTLFGSKITEIKNVLVKHYENIGGVGGGGITSEPAYLLYIISEYFRGILGVFFFCCLKGWK